MLRDLLPRDGTENGAPPDATTLERGRGITDLSRRALLVGSVAAFVMPAWAQGTAMPSMRMVRANSINLAVHEAGSGPAVVLLHGFPGLAFAPHAGRAAKVMEQERQWTFSIHAAASDWALRPAF